MEVIQIVLLAVATFIFAIDQFSLTEVIYRPMVACPIIGMILGDVKVGLAIGGTYELMMIGNGQYIVTLVFTVMSGLMATADKAAEAADPKGITKVNVISCCLLGGLFALIAVLAYVGGVALAEPLQALSTNASWLMAGFSAAGGMMRYVGFAVLLKIMLANDMWGIYFAGFAAAALFGNVPAVSGATLILVAFVGIAIAIYDYNTNIRLGEGGSSDGI